ncbi:hypothetical protein A3I45_00770 [Candidatus Uhrbacteria bacterium RIFCSPLOWO2_02_FULL_53_10]|uniref:UDP-N-acetylmuramoyl-tripeptide--D-alanyl-D-alanine ligase n=1 Tax=Candidatus Uhrbacteria bacterium RIFCSPLOWO2_02_FULL_53_10 TaxID=1802411 RepID=A0A1F7VFJ7_9BACT|nr:MAG: hypothetical protein A3I45_00770 [Candidatus Uhrbacteria bacterium RIFCSPLOWO2_02_FULL_53_10]
MIGITGSVGKTSTREAVRCALGNTRRVRAAVQNYNNELGLPLTVLGESAQDSSLIGWAGVLWRGWYRSWRRQKDNPDVLVLEYGADRKGDMVYLTSIARPHVAVLTSVAPAHTEFFGSLEDVAEEKSQLIRALPDDGVAVLNADDGRVRGMKVLARGAVVTAGYATDADVRVEDVQLSMHYDGSFKEGQRVSELRCLVRAGRDRAEVVLTNVLGDGHVHSMVLGIAAALQTGLSLENIARNLRAYAPMPGRLNLLPGVKQTLLLDDSYNASPAATHMALEALATIPITGETHRIAALGDMLELGAISQKSHYDVGAHVAALPIDLLVAVGEQAREVARGALEAGMPQERVFTYARAQDAGRFIQDHLKPGDAVLIKGSQGVRMEKITKELMANPLRAKELLVRQSKGWQ